uniref:RNase III domain-containing protein n=1 Tax=viral metagenome TaxID=1070528 RepID=A0A6C0L1Q6_9ZZZZ|tara:strand:+ start:820 stop:1611 length:792 start_codon:yes stop_codon:yes gene_type:complete
MDKFRANPYNLNNRFITSNDIVNIMKTLNIDNFKINDISHYQTAFIHKSYCKLSEYTEYEYPGSHYLPLQDISYEAMEFLGDSILGSVVCSYLYKRFYGIHKQNEGFLTKLKIRLVCGENLCEFSKRIHFQKYLIISNHIEEKCSGRENSNILEDVFEAFIGALFLDHNYQVAEDFIIRVIEKYFDFTDILLRDNNYKDQISRYFQQNFGVYPVYKTERIEDIGFRTEILKEGEIIIQGEGISKKKSEQDASKRALIFYNVIT